MEWLERVLKDAINVRLLTPLSAIYGFLQTNQELFLILSYLLLLFKCYVYVSRCSKTISLIALKRNIKKTYILGKKIFPNMMKRRKVFSPKNGVKFLFISKLVINCGVGGAWVYFWH